MIRNQKIRKKESSDRLLYAGLIVIILSSIMDLVGVSVGKWIYPIKIVPSTVIFIPFAFSVIPLQKPHQNDPRNVGKLAISLFLTSKHLLKMCFHVCRAENSQQN